MGFFDKIKEKEEKFIPIKSEEPKTKLVEIRYRFAVQEEIFGELDRLNIKYETKKEGSGIGRIICSEEDKETVEYIIDNAKLPSLTGGISKAEAQKNGSINSVHVHGEKTYTQNFDEFEEENYHPLNQNFETENENFEPEFISSEPEEVEEIFFEDEKTKDEIEEKKPKKARKKLGRDIRKGARFTAEEWKNISEKIEKSGLPEGEFIRTALIKTKVVVKERTKNSEEILENTKEIKSEIGKIGGMIKQIMSKEEGLSADEKENFFVALRSIQDMKLELQNIEKRM